MLSDVEAGRLLKALFEYNRTGALPEHLKNGTAILFAQLRAQHDRDRQRYERKCETNRENIQKRWEKQEEPQEAEKTGRAEEPEGAGERSGPKEPEEMKRAEEPKRRALDPGERELMDYWKSRQRDFGVES